MTIDIVRRTAIGNRLALASMFAVLCALLLPRNAAPAGPPAQWVPDAVVQHLDLAARAIARERGLGGYQGMDPLAGQLQPHPSVDDPKFAHLSELALHASPDSSAVRWERFQHALDSGSVGASLKEGLGFAVAAVSDPWLLLRGLSALGLVICVAAWLAVLALASVHAFSCGPLLLHDYSDSFPRRLRRVTPIAFFLFVISVLWVAGVGPLVVLSLLGLVLTPYMNARARLAFGISVCIGCLLPIAWGELERESGVGGDAAWSTYRVWRGDSGGDLYEELRRAEALEPGRKEYLLARLSRRDGDLPRARQLLGKAEGQLGAGFLANEQGNLAFLEGETDRALSLYQQAAHARPDDPIPLINQHLTHLRRLELEAADAVLSRARGLDGSAVEKFEAARSMVPDIPLPVSHAIPRAWLLSAYFAGDTPNMEGADVIRSTLFLPGRVLRPEFVGLFALFVSVVAGRTGQQRRSRRCTSCGFVVCPRCSRRVKGSMLCSACWSADNDKDVDAAERLRKEESATHWASHCQRGRIVTHLLLPGWGDYLRSAPWLGGAVTLLWAGGAGLAAVAFLDPVPLLPWGGLPLGWTGGAVGVGLAYLFGVWRALRRV
jgi:tetratricopeptide (TPR) repeat protein